MRLVDGFAGCGGWSAGASDAGCEPVLGIDWDERPLRLWATNFPSARAVCATLGTDAVEWPAAEPDVHCHLSPPCVLDFQILADAPRLRGVTQNTVIVTHSVYILSPAGHRPPGGCSKVDAVIHNFRPGAAERMGADYPTLSAIKVRCALPSRRPDPVPMARARVLGLSACLVSAILRAPHPDGTHVCCAVLNPSRVSSAMTMPTSPR